MSVSEIICCGGWPLDKKQFRYNIILIFYIYIYIYIYISSISQTRYQHDALARFRGVIIILPLEKVIPMTPLLTFIYINIWHKFTFITSRLNIALLN